MKRILTLLALHIIFNSATFAQDDDVFKRLHGIPVKTSLFVNFDGNRFEFINDRHQPPFYPLNDKVFKIANDYNNTLLTYLKFYNPLKYNIQFSMKEIEDGNFQAISKFMSSLTMDPSITAVAATAGTGTGSAAAKTAGHRYVVPSPDPDQKQFVASALMYTWINQFKALSDQTLISANLAKYNEIVEIINSIENTESFLYGKVKISGVEHGVSEWIKGQAPRVYAAVGMKNFTDSLTEVEGVKDQLITAQSASKKALSDISKLLTDKFSDIALFVADVKDQADLRQTSLAVKSMLSIQTNDRSETLGQAITKFSDFVAGLKKNLSEYDTVTEARKIYENEFKYNYDKAREYTFNSTLIKADGSEDTQKQTAVYQVTKEQGMVLFASTGAFYTPFAYKNYGISDGAVAPTKESKVFARPAAYLNMVFSRKSGDILYWLAQVGLSVGNSSPLVPVGGGFILRNNLSITTGVLFAWQNELDGLKIGDQADDAALKNAIQKTVVPSWYLSLSFKIGK